MIYDMFVCHEVAHALWTPLNMIDKIREQGIDKSVVNVIEDVHESSNDTEKILVLLLISKKDIKNY